MTRHDGAATPIGPVAPNAVSAALGQAVARNRWVSRLKADRRDRSYVIVRREGRIWLQHSGCGAR